MFKITPLFKKILLAGFVLALTLAAFPAAGASAAGTADQSTPQVTNLRLERVWAREQRIFQRQGNRLENAAAFISRAQTLIDQANQKGWDTSAVQSALNDLSAVIPAVQAAHDKGLPILSSHAGFDASGKITDRASAVTATKALAQVLKDTHTAMNGTGQALRQAIRDFRQAHPRPAPAPKS